MQGIKHFLLALQFFTRIPVTGGLAQWVGFSPAMLRAAAGHFPGVGLVVGTVAALAYATLALHLPPSAHTTWVAAVLSTALTVYATGGFHEDGLADTADGLGGSVDRERALAIMKDSRLGAYGALALVLALLSKISLLALLGQLSLGATLVVVVWGHTLSRAWVLISLGTLSHVGDSATSKAKPLADQLPKSAPLTALLWLAATAAGLLWLHGALPTSWWGSLRDEAWLAAMATATAVSGLGWAWVHRLLHKRLQGFTGDGLGAAQQVAEIGCYLGLAWALGG